MKFIGSLIVSLCIRLVTVWVLTLSIRYKLPFVGAAGNIAAFIVGIAVTIIQTVWSRSRARWMTYLAKWLPPDINFAAVAEAAKQVAKTTQVKEAILSAFTGKPVSDETIREALYGNRP